MKSCVWDIETTHLKPNFGVMLCGCVKECGGPITTIENKVRGKNDRQMCIDLRDELEKYDILIGYYTLGFDLKFLNSKLMHYGDKPLSPKFHVDVYRLARRFMNTSSRSLAVITEYFGIKGKTRVDPELWMSAGYDWDRKAMKEIVSHCRFDVDILEKTWEKLKHFQKGVSRV
jgi:DNA polymerase elongation subunit (family B)